MQPNAITALRGLSRRRKPAENCELCSLPLGPEHPHLLQRSNRQIICACQACALLFSYREQGAKYIRIPRDIRRLPPLQITDNDWNQLRLPIDLAFFVRRSDEDRVLACYPGPAGTAESSLSVDHWKVFDQMAPDVEALLVNRTGGRRECYIVPIDACYRLTGLIRLHWRGLSGGEEVWRQVDTFFENLEPAHA